MSACREHPLDPIRSNVSSLHSWAHGLLLSGHLTPLHTCVRDGADLLQRRFDFLIQLTQLAHLNRSNKQHILAHVTSANADVSKSLSKLKLFAAPLTGPWYLRVVAHTETLLLRDLQLQFNDTELTERSKKKVDALRKHADQQEIILYIHTRATAGNSAAAAAAASLGSSSSSISPHASPTPASAASSASRSLGAMSSNRSKETLMRKKVSSLLSRHLFTDIVSHFRDAEKSMRYLFESMQSNAVGQDGEIMQELLDEATELFELTEPMQLSDVLGVQKPASHGERRPETRTSHESGARSRSHADE